MSVNVMTMDEINEVSGADLPLDLAEYGLVIGSTYGLITNGAVGAAYFGPYGMAVGFVLGASIELGSWFWENRQLF